MHIGNELNDNAIFKIIITEQDITIKFVVNSELLTTANFVIYKDNINYINILNKGNKLYDILTPNEMDAFVIMHGVDNNTMTEKFIPAQFNVFNNSLAIKLLNDKIDEHTTLYGEITYSKDNNKLFSNEDLLNHLLDIENNDYIYNDISILSLCSYVEFGKCAVPAT